MSEAWQFHGYTLGEIFSQLGAPCQATLVNGKSFSGHLYNVDPETLTLLILRLPQGQEHVQESEGKDDKNTIERNEQAEGVIYLVEQQPLALNEPQEQEPKQIQAPVSPTKSQNQSDATENNSTQSAHTEGRTMAVIRQHALKSFVIGNRLTIESMETLAGLPTPPNVSPVDIKSRKQSIIAMLQSQRIPVKTTTTTPSATSTTTTTAQVKEEQEEQEGGELEDEVIHLLVGSAQIRPPYTTSTVDCPNKVILERVQGMIREHDLNH
ncbi:hypothetical protein BGX23_003904 [Mortierella sp. AD031]|nr:hypothetical protein BGX23_003904 [Mortierella sp. AD031]